MAIALVVALLVLGVLAEASRRATRRIERAIPPQGEFLDLNGQRVHYLDVGEGPVLVLIHGLGGQMGNFTHSLVDRLKGDFRVVAFDRPGSGYSTRPVGSSAGIKAQAAPLAKAIRMLGLEPAIVVGHSLGGAVALAIALDSPDCARALVLLSPLTHPVARPPLLFLGLAIRPPLLRRMVAWTVATPASLLARRWGARIVFAPEPAPPNFAVLGGSLLGIRPANIYASSEDMLAANDDLRDLVPRYPSIGIPAGVLYGSGDAILDWREQGETMRTVVPGLELEVVEGGHMLPVTVPDVVAAFIRKVAARADTEPGSDR